jgi:hypothetical protein
MVVIGPSSVVGPTLVEGLGVVVPVSASEVLPSVCSGSVVGPHAAMLKPSASVTAAIAVLPQCANVVA